ncbi:4635_t:CDS:1, partial [Ambispora gerdemannii]
MNSQEPEVNITTNTNLNDVLFFNNFDYVPDDYDMENIESMDLATKSLTSESTITGSVVNDASDFNIEINPFHFDKANFEVARALAEADNDNDIFLLKDIDIDTETESNDILTSELNSITSNSNDENEYFIENIEENTNQALSVCLILDLIDDRIQRCLNHSQKNKVHLLNLLELG